MPYDVVPVVKHLVQAMQPVTSSQGINLFFKPGTTTLLVNTKTGDWILPLTTLLTRLINYLNSGDQITLFLQNCNNGFRLRLEHTGRDLSRVLEIHKDLPVTVAMNSFQGKYSYQMEYFFTSQNEPAIEPEKKSLQNPPQYYAEIRKRLTTHFNRSENLVNALSRYNTRDAIFLKRINDLVMENMDNPQVDANFISQAMNLSRTQLFRRLKPIIRQSPGNYIKSLRLQKAKELFETTDLRVGEVAFRTGFETPANFTRAFTRQFGFSPSLLCKRKQ